MIFVLVGDGVRVVTCQRAVDVLPVPHQLGHGSQTGVYSLDWGTDYLMAMDLLEIDNAIVMSRVGALGRHIGCLRR